MAECNGFPMGLYQSVFGSDGTTLNFSLKQKFRWQFMIENITSGLVNVEPLPCIRASRPKLNFREMSAEHLNEVIYFPSKPDWQTIQIVIYDRCIQSENPIMTWLKQQYNPGPSNEGSGCSEWYPCIDLLSYKPCATLVLYSPCGQIVEGWTLEHVYPVNIDFGDLDMSSTEIVVMDVTLRYDRAWQFAAAGEGLPPPHSLYNNTSCSTCEVAVCESTPSEGGDDGQTENPESENPGAQGGGANDQNTINLGGSGNGTATLSGNTLTVVYDGSSGNQSLLNGYVLDAQASFNVTSPVQKSIGETNGVVTATYTVSRPFAPMLAREPDFIMF